MTAYQGKRRAPRNPRRLPSLRWPRRLRLRRPKLPVAAALTMLRTFWADVLADTAPAAPVLLPAPTEGAWPYDPRDQKVRLAFTDPGHEPADIVPAVQP